MKVNPNSKDQALSAECSSGRQRILLVASILAYIGSFQWMYVHYLYPTWDYFGFDYNPPSTGYLILAWILSVAPSLWMPLKLTRPSQLAYWVLYIAVIIPSMFVPLVAGLTSATEVSFLMVTLFVGFAISGASYFLPLHHFPASMISRGLFWKGFGLVAVTLALWMMVAFRNNLHIVSFLDAYDLRDASADIAEGSQVNYAFMLLTGAINPFLMGYGLYHSRRAIFLAGAAGQLLVYSVGGTKGSVLSILFIPVFYILLKIRKLHFGVALTLGALSLIVFSCSSLVLTGYNPDPFHSLVLFVILMRTLSLNGLVTAQYFDFFQKNPFTYFSHIKGVSWILPYPYKYVIGQEIGQAYAGTTGLNATAHFWATDGIGGLGLPGVLLISVFCALVFWLLDSVAKRHDARFVALVISYAAYNIANISIFTSLLSGGLMLLIFLLYLLPQQKESFAGGSQKLPFSGPPDRALLPASG